jgi:hypothetical protein
MGSLTSNKPIGLHGLLRGYLYITLVLGSLGCVGVAESCAPSSVAGNRATGLTHYSLVSKPTACMIPKNYKVEEDEMGGTCGTKGGEEKRV